MTFDAAREQQVRAPERARREALIESGGLEQVKEEVRAIRAGALLEQLVQDVRYTLRGPGAADSLMRVPSAS